MMMDQYKVTYRCAKGTCDSPCYLKFSTCVLDKERVLCCPFGGNLETKFELLDWSELE